MITQFDHIVLTVTDVKASSEFFEKACLMTVVTSENGRTSLIFGSQKINLQVLGQETRNRAQVGAGDLCLVTEWSIESVLDHLNANEIEVLEGPVIRDGALGKMESIYFLDPDSNLIEISHYRK